MQKGQCGARTLFNFDGRPHGKTFPDDSCATSGQRSTEMEADCDGVGVDDTCLNKRIPCYAPNGARENDVGPQVS